MEGLPSNLTGALDQIEQGGIISEVGPPVLMDSPFGSIACYQLREAQKFAIPWHLFGKVDVGDAFSNFTPIIVDVPAVGAEISVSPKFHPAVIRMLKNYWWQRADAQFVVRMAEPLGASHLFEITPSFIEDGAVTKGVRWKPTVASTISFDMPWEHHIKMRADNSKGNPFSGFDLKIKLIEDNSSKDIQGPFKMTIWSRFYNVFAAGYFESGSFELPAHFARNGISKPAPMASKPVYREFQSDDIPAEGVGDASGNTIDIQVEAPGDNLEVKPVESTQAVAKPMAYGTSKPNAGATSNRWYHWTTLNFGNDQLGKKVNIEFDPYRTLNSFGDGIFRSYNRNVYVVGESINGFARTLRAKFVSYKPPYLAGLFEINTQNSGNGDGGHSYFHELGGTPTEVPIAPTLFDNNNSGSSLAQTLLRPWIKCSSGQVRLSIRLLNYNSTTAAALSKVNVFINAQHVSFNVPLKPKKPIKTVTLEECERMYQNLLSDKIALKLEDFNVIANMLAIEPPSHRELQSDDMAIAPSAGLVPVESSLTYASDTEELDQDDFWVQIHNSNIKVGDMISIPIHMPAAVDILGNDGVSTIAEKFSRFGYAVPTTHNAFGPIIGQYKIVANLPATIRCNLAHVAISPDLDSELALRLFGLDSILGIAGSFIDTIGGGLINGLINTAGNIIGPILGIGGNKEESKPAPQETGSNIGGQIPMDRLLEMLLTALVPNSNTGTRPSHIMIQLLDLLSSSLTKAPESIPISVYVKLAPMGMKRNLFDRVDFTPTPPPKPTLMLTHEEGLDILSRLALSGKDKHFNHCLALTRLLMKRSSEINILDVLHAEQIDDAEAKQLLRSVALYTDMQLES